MKYGMAARMRGVKVGEVVKSYKNATIEKPQEIKKAETSITKSEPGIWRKAGSHISAPIGNMFTGEGRGLGGRAQNLKNNIEDQILQQNQNKLYTAAYKAGISGNMDAV